MVTVGSFDAKTHLPKLLDRVAKGETVQITKRGVPVARLIPVLATETIDPKESVKQIRQLRKGITLGKTTLRELINKGRP